MYRFDGFFKEAAEIKYVDWPEEATKLRLDTAKTVVFFSSEINFSTLSSKIQQVEFYTEVTDNGNIRLVLENPIHVSKGDHVAIECYEDHEWKEFIKKDLLKKTKVRKTC